MRITPFSVMGQVAHPCFLPGCEPDVGGIMRNVRRIDQGNQDIDIEKKIQGASSLSALTISSVMMVFLLPVGSKGIPFLS